MKSNFIYPFAAGLEGQIIIKGSVGWDGVQYEVFAMRHTLGSPDQAGTYPVTLWPNPTESGSALPAENGSGTLIVKKDGTATMSGSLGDGTRLTASGHLSTDGKWALYAPLYNKTGAIGGWWIFEPWKTSQRVKGSLRRIKAAGDSSAYAGGFNGLVTGEGAMFAPWPVFYQVVLKCAEFAPEFGQSRSLAEWRREDLLRV